MSPPSPSPPHPTTIIASLLTHLSTLPPRTTNPPPHPHPQEDPLFPEKPHLLTLHALLPTTLLPALDLLDRQLITRFELSDTQLEASTASDAANVVPQALDPTSNGDDVTEHAQYELQAEGVALPATAQPHPHLQAKRKPNPLYYVRSSHTSSSSRYSRPGRDPRPRQQGPEEGKSYEVRTQAWSCSCAAFGFAAFHYGGGDGGEEEEEDEDGGLGDDGATEVQEDGAGDGHEGWSRENREGERGREEDRLKWGGLMAFYGQSRSGRRYGGGQRLPLPLPLCKHLLACVLAEWWREAEDMVERKVVGENELAGWAAGWGG